MKIKEYNRGRESYLVSPSTIATDSYLLQNHIKPGDKDISLKYHEKDTPTQLSLKVIVV